MYDANERLGTMLREGRLRKRLTPGQLANEIDLSVSYERDLERNRVSPSLDVFCRIMRQLDLSADDYVYPEKTGDGSVRTELRRIIDGLNDRQLSLLLDSARQIQQDPS
ncbi:MAG: helix-turn-helix domain-containing protein [Lachnospiraceae bacterium]|nr:helix-turn-helix domain-containing protein [Lachnospiraceae bacterium]